MMFRKPKSKELLRFAQSAKIAAHRAEQHVQDDKDRASQREDLSEQRGLRRTPGQCRKHRWVFDIVFSFENGEGEMEVCANPGCDARRTVESTTYDFRAGPRSVDKQEFQGATQDFANGPKPKPKRRREPDEDDSEAWRSIRHRYRF